MRAIRTERFKYIFRPHESDELYDLREDPAELRNLIADSRHAATLAELRRDLVDWMQRTNDPAAKGAELFLTRQDPTFQALASPGPMNGVA